jgi:hypothetical protein
MALASEPPEFALVYCKNPDQEPILICDFLHPFAQRFASAVSRFFVDTNENRSHPTLSCLQPGNEFEAVRGHDTIVVIRC